MCRRSISLGAVMKRGGVCRIDWVGSGREEVVLMNRYCTEIEIEIEIEIDGWVECGLWESGGSRWESGGCGFFFVIEYTLYF